MVLITPELVRKRAEHNDMELSTLEEISLHQLNIEKIEHLDRWCPKLKILLLQGNIINKIENVRRLRELEYLNLALNNIEKISGLENCESLRKLDLTANFVIDLQSLKCLQDLSNLEELYLTGNPCTKYHGYRGYVINHLPYLKELDGVAILRSERLSYKLKTDSINQSIEEEEMLSFEQRKIQREKYKNQEQDKIHEDGEDEIKRWNDELTENCPEMRTTICNEIQRRRKRDEEKNHKEKKPIKYFANDGHPLNMNKANIEFTFKEDEQENTYVLEVKTYRYLSGDHLECDVQPTYVRVTIKGLPLQIVYPTEVEPSSATALRSQVTGHLLITAPKLDVNKILTFNRGKAKETKKEPDKKISKEQTQNIFLEIKDTNFKDKLLIESNPNIFTNPPPKINKPTNPRPDSPNFVDDPDVPPLE